jgi:small subunit ribosomal protein S3
MGQKVDPRSMRLQVSKNWRSRWFATGRDYTKTLGQDLEARKLIEESYDKRAAIARVDIERSQSMATVTIYTAKAGVVIGRGGSGVEELRDKLAKILDTSVRVNVEELKKAELYAKIVADNIASQLERRINYRRAVKQTAAATMRAGAEGVRIELKGRLNNAEMARHEKEIQGSVPLHTIRADIDYALTTAKTAAGTIGVKVWINKGEVLR